MKGDWIWFLKSQKREMWKSKKRQKIWSPALVLTVLLTAGIWPSVRNFTSWDHNLLYYETREEDKMLSKFPSCLWFQYPNLCSVPRLTPTPSRCSHSLWGIRWTTVFSVFFLLYHTRIFASSVVNKTDSSIWWTSNMHCPAGSKMALWHKPAWRMMGGASPSKRPISRERPCTFHASIQNQVSFPPRLAAHCWQLDDH